MYPEKMLKVEIAVVSSKLEDLVDDLHEEGIIHFDIVKDLNWIKNAPPHSSIELLSEKVKYIRDCLFIAKKIGLTFGIKSNKKYSKEILEDFINRHKEIVDLEKELEWVKGNLKTSKILEKFGINNERFEQKRFLFDLYEVNFKHLKEIKNMSQEKDIDFDTVKISKNYYVLLSGGPKGKNIAKIKEGSISLLLGTLKKVTRDSKGLTKL